MTTPLHNAIILSSILGSLLSEYDVKNPKENIKPIQILRKRLRKFMSSRGRTNYKIFLESVKIGDEVWKKSVDHFASKNMKLEVISTFVRLYDLYEDELSRFASIHNKQVEAFAIHQTSSLSKEIEHSSYDVADYMLNELSVFTGKKRRKLNLLERVAWDERD